MRRTTEYLIIILSELFSDLVDSMGYKITFYAYPECKLEIVLIVIQPFIIESSTEKPFK